MFLKFLYGFWIGKYQIFRVNCQPISNTVRWIRYRFRKNVIFFSFMFCKFIIRKNCIGYRGCWHCWFHTNTQLYEIYNSSNGFIKTTRILIGSRRAPQKIYKNFNWNKHLPCGNWNQISEKNFLNLNILIGIKFNWNQISEKNFLNLNILIGIKFNWNQI